MVKIVIKITDIENNNTGVFVESSSRNSSVSEEFVSAVVRNHLKGLVDLEGFEEGDNND